MMLFESIRNPQLRNVLNEGPMNNVQFLSRYFSHLISEGILGDGDPQVYTDSLISIVFGYAIGLISLRDEKQIDESLDHLDKMITEVFLPGIDN